MNTSRSSAPAWRRGRLGPLAALVLLMSAVTTAAAQPVSPFVHFGFQMGEDGKLASWPEIERYFRRMDDASDRVTVVGLGPTTEGRQMIAAFVSAPEHIARLTQIRERSRQLADPRALGDDEAAELGASQPAILAIGASIHASEIGATQTMNELLFELATTTDARLLDVLRQVVIVLIPSLNPDGHEMVVQWFAQQQGTPFANAPMPWLYHKYAGHDINRDGFMLNLQENRNLARFFYRDTHPQVFLTMHEMAQNGPRFFVPPNYDPIDLNYDPLVWRTAGLLGHGMALEMERDGRSGVISHALFDYFWPGYEDSATIGHNTVSLLTEVAAAALANPVTIARTDLVGAARGLPEYRPQVNFPNPWPGGSWRLRDIVDYELSAVRGLMVAVSRYRREIVSNFYEMGKRAIDKGATAEPAAFVIEPAQSDPLAATSLVNTLIDGGVEVRRSLEPFRIEDKSYPAGTTFISMMQPYRAYAKTLLEVQTYPIRRLAPNAQPERPYDVTAWTLPLQMGVNVTAVKQEFEAPPNARLERAEVTVGQVWGDRRPRHYVIEAGGTSGAMMIGWLQSAALPVAWITAPVDFAGRRYARGSLVVRHSNESRAIVERAVRTLGVHAAGVRDAPASVRPIARARVALYKPWYANIDEGWTRFLLEKFSVPFTSLSLADVRAGRLLDKYEVLILPHEEPDRLLVGHRPGTVPTMYAGGLEGEGLEAIKAFVKDGGTLVCLDASCGLAVSALNLPLRDGVSEEPSRVYGPGTIVALELDEHSSLAYGMTNPLPAFFVNGAAWEPATPGAVLTPAARYRASDTRLSGWLDGADRLAGRAAVLELPVGAGRVVLIGVRSQHRAQSHGTFRLLLNAIYTHAPAATLGKESKPARTSRSRP